MIDDDRRLRVALVTNMPVPYRVSTWERLAAQPGLRLTLVFCTPREHDRGWPVPEPAVDHVTLPGLALRHRGRSIHLNPGVSGVLRRLRPQVLVTTGFNPTHLLAIVQGLMRGVAHVAQTDGTLLSESALGPLHRAVRRAVFRRTAAFVGAGEGSLALYRSYGVPEDRLFRSPLCVDNAAYAPRPDDRRDLDLLFSGRLVGPKNPLFALQVAQAVARRLGRRVSLGVAGAGPLEPALRQAAAAAPEVDVHLAGFVPPSALPAWYRRGRVFLFPTAWDTWGVVVNEACAAGLPVIATPQAGASGDLVLDGHTGRVLPLGVEAWADTAAAWLADPATLNQLGERARERVQAWNADAACAGLAQAIRRAASG